MAHHVFHRGALSEFRPDDLSNTLHYWRFWDGDSISGISADADVTSATDLVGSADLDLVNAAYAPSYAPGQLGGRDALFFDGTEYMRSANITLGAFTVFCVSQVDRQAGATGLVYEHTAQATTTSGMYLNAGTTGTILHKNTGGQSAYNTSTAWWSKTTPQVTIQRSDGTHAGHSLRVNGDNKTLASLGGFTGDPGTADVTDRLYIGARASATSFINGWISEIAVFSGSLSDDDCALLDAYTVANYDLGY